MAKARADGNGLLWQQNDEHVWVVPWGRSAVRVRAWCGPQPSDAQGALLPAEEAPAESTVTAGETQATLVNGDISVVLNDAGTLLFKNRNGDILLNEPAVGPVKEPPRYFANEGGTLWRAEQRFASHEGERFYGLGQHRHGCFDQKGAVLDLRQPNCEVAIPFLVSSRGYGFLWNNPAIGRVELGQTETRWVAERTESIDYWVTCADTPKQILNRYADATGHAPDFPQWASGFWQSKLRYKTQEELLSVAREYQRRGIPLSVIVIDFFHWNRLGDFSFSADEWPDPEAMVQELSEMGVKPMVSVWPALNLNSDNFSDFQSAGAIVRSSSGYARGRFIDKDVSGAVYLNFYDPTAPAGRELIWNKIRDGYYRQGFRLFWLDCCEPALRRDEYEHMQLHAGDGKAHACRYPLDHQRAFYEGMTAAGEEETLFLCRSAWAGSQRYGAAVWSGDIQSTFEVFGSQIRAGLNMAMSGIPWWNTDIGGFLHGDPQTDYFRELVVRWFQYGTFSPIMRLHGVREPAVDHRDSGAPNEVWSFGDAAYEILHRYIMIRERLRPYIHEQMQRASEHGTPLMRPLFLDFPGDSEAWDVDDAYMFGDDLLVAPVYVRGQSSRYVYLPGGEKWTHVWSGTEHTGGRTLQIDAPLEEIPIFVREGGQLRRDVILGG